MSVDVDVEVHPPERGERSLLLASGCCTTCCCCSCCVHSLGAVVGVAAAASIALAAEATASGERGGEPDEKVPVVPPSAVVLVVALLTAFLSTILLVLGSRDLEVVGLALAILFPLVLLGCLVLALPVAALAGKRGMTVWVKLLAGAVVGTGVGAVLTVVGGIALAAVAGL